MTERTPNGALGEDPHARLDRLEERMARMEEALEQALCSLRATSGALGAIPGSLRQEVPA